MHRFCKRCGLKSDFQDCEQCGKPTVEVDESYEVKYQLVCSECGSLTIRSRDHHSPRMYCKDTKTNPFCPRCGKKTKHHFKFLSSELQTEENLYLEKAFKEELRQNG